ncbi:hypothetical protein T484DRAFT_1988936 [Baffinella frigidus]|nr:hypothetical protein T484DRAFT_1988936 [Cryptophyta sp. CCMP2293]
MHCWRGGDVPLVYLQNGLISSANEIRQTRAAAAIRLDGASVEADAEEREGQSFLLCLVTASRTYRFGLPIEADQKEWRDALQYATGVANEGERSRSRKRQGITMLEE